MMKAKSRLRINTHRLVCDTLHLQQFIYKQMHFQSPILIAIISHCTLIDVKAIYNLQSIHSV